MDEQISDSDVAVASWELLRALLIGLVRKGVLSPSDSQEILNESIGYCNKRVEKLQTGDKALAAIFSDAAQLLRRLLESKGIKGE